MASARCSRSWRRARSSGSAVACGPAASSASVTAEIASSSGNSDGATRSMPITTEVSTRPRSRRASAKGCRILVEHAVHVLPEPGRLDRRRAREGRRRGLGRDEDALAERRQLADGHAVARDHERLTAVERSHDLAALVAELALVIRRASKPNVARALRLDSRVRILVAEDETIIRLDLRGLLERAGHEVVGEARDGEEAVELARELEPDLAVMDVKMPRLDGIEAARRILEERPIPIVMLTAFDQRELVERAAEVGVYGYLVKPFREQDVVPAIETARARHAELVAVRAEADSLAGGARRAQGDRAREGPADGEGEALRGGRVRAPAQGEPGLGPAARGDRRGRDRYV